MVKSKRSINRMRLRRPSITRSRKLSPLLKSITKVPGESTRWWDVGLFFARGMAYALGVAAVNTYVLPLLPFHG